jgi:hypothetical protein
MSLHQRALLTLEVKNFWKDARQKERARGKKDLEGLI